MSMTVAPDQIDRIVWIQHHDPFEVLGPHQIQDNGKSSWVVRAYLPRASAAWVVRPEERKEYAMQPVHHPNFFECVLDVEQLSNMIADLLGTTSLQPVILVGVGNLGLALLSYRGFEQEGFEIIAAFDEDAQQKPEKPAGTPIYPMEHLPEVVQQNAVRMAILTVPAAAAQEVANQLIDAGISGILNFAPIVLHVPDEVTVNNVNLAIELENLSYFIQQ